MLLRFMRCSAFNLAFYGMFMEYSWGVQLVLGVFAFLETTALSLCLTFLVAYVHASSVSNEIVF